MADYIEREALMNRLLKVAITDDGFGMGVQFGVDHAIECLREAPAADVVPVVRCKDCKHNVENWNHDELDVTDYTDITCDFFMTDGMQPDDFCSYGERKDGDTK